MRVNDLEQRWFKRWGVELFRADNLGRAKARIPKATEYGRNNGKFQHRPRRHIDSRDLKIRRYRRTPVYLVTTAHCWTLDGGHWTFDLCRWTGTANRKQFLKRSIIRSLVFTEDPGEEKYSDHLGDPGWSSAWVSHATTLSWSSRPEMPPRQPDDLISHYGRGQAYGNHRRKLFRWQWSYFGESK